MRFTRKEIIFNSKEWDEVYNTTRGGDGFPCTNPLRGWDNFPVLVLEADNPNIRYQSYNSKAYIFISASDIRELLNGKI